MNRTNVKYDVLGLLGRLHKEHPTKSPYIFGPGFEMSKFKTFDVDKEMIIPDAMCINSYVQDVLSEPKTYQNTWKNWEDLEQSDTT